VRLHEFRAETFAKFVGVFSLGKTKNPVFFTVYTNRFVDRADIAILTEFRNYDSIGALSKSDR
jgi:hypothetical protein